MTGASAASESAMGEVKPTGLSKPPSSGGTDDSDILIVPAGFVVKPGAKLEEDTIVGEYLGGGYQGCVWTLLDSSGRPLKKLLKSEGKVVIISDVEREWRVGKELGKLSVPGFMGVLRGVKDEKSGVMIAMEMEKLNGKSMDQIITKSDFNDVHYIRAMLMGVFTALAAAQSLGFHHCDLRMSNIMEHTDPVTGVREFKIIDYGLVKWDANYPAGLNRTTKAFFKAGKDFKGARDVRAVAEEVKARIASSKQQLIPLADLGESIHKTAWKHKGDVYHVLLDLLGILDHRIWPTADAISVLLLSHFIQHVTGVRMKARFANDAKCGVKESDPQMFIMKRKMFGIVRFFRKMSITFQGWEFPRNPGITAAEALTSPFFQHDWCQACAGGRSMSKEGIPYSMTMDPAAAYSAGDTGAAPSRTNTC